MKKHFLLLLTIMLCAVGTAWGQYNQTFTATYTVNENLTYSGAEQTGFTVGTTNCSYKVTGDKATNAGTYAGAITSDCGGHYLSLGGYDQIVWDHIGTINVNWVILPCDLTDVGVTIEAQDVQWTGSDINISDAIKTAQFKGSDMTKGTDYDVYVTKESIATSVKNEGRYTLVFTGKGNFTGTITRTFDVKKDMSKGEDITGVHYDIPEQIRVEGEAFEFQYEVSDKISHAKLYVDEDYTVELFTDDACTSPADEANMTEGKYWAKFTGVAPKYDPTTSITKAFYVVNEYQTYDHATYADINMRITKAGYPVATDSPTGQAIPGEMEVAPLTDGNPAIDLASTQCEIPEKMTVPVTDDLNFNIVGIQNNSFSGCATLRWINSLIPSDAWTPSSLDRTIIDTPFYGLPKPTIVYLYGSTVKGENYVYKITDSDFRSERYHIYEDVIGDQTKYSDDK